MPKVTEASVMAVWQFTVPVLKGTEASLMAVWKFAVPVSEVTEASPMGQAILWSISVILDAQESR